MCQGSRRKQNKWITTIFTTQFRLPNGQGSLGCSKRPELSGMELEVNLFSFPSPLFSPLSSSSPLFSPHSPTHIACFSSLLAHHMDYYPFLEYCLPRNSFRSLLKHQVISETFLDPEPVELDAFSGVFLQSGIPSIIIPVCPSASPFRWRILCEQRLCLICLCIFSI